MRERNYKSVLYFSLIQNGKNAYNLDIPVVARFKNSIEPYRTILNLNRRAKFFKLELDEAPISFEIDPEFDVFRKISPQETPATLSRILGSNQPLIILPSKAGKDKLKKYQDFALAWNKDESNLPEIKMDSELSSLPKDRAFWLIGKENIFFETYSQNLENLKAKLNGKEFIYENTNFELENNTFVFSAINPSNENFSSGLILTNSPDNLKALARKLPHYGKYSYLIFDNEMNNIKTGLWTIVNSPLKTIFREIDNKIYFSKSSLKERKALIYPTSDFSIKDINKTIEFLSKKLQGRGPNSPQKEKAADFISKEFKKFSLETISNNSYFQEWSETINGEIIHLKNVMGKIEGYDKKFKNDYVIIGAHYDHLPAKDGVIYPGADDNASGIALMLELAKFYSNHKTARTLIFIAFDGEEDGRIGSKYFLKTLEKNDLKKINAMINIDSVGRLNNKKILILNSASSSYWKHIFTGAGFETGVDLELIEKELDSSDQISFSDEGVPSVQIFSGVHLDYHKPSDTIEKIDFNGIIKTAELTREVLNYLAADTAFIERHGNQIETETMRKEVHKRTVSTGLAPSFSWQGEGIEIDSITPDSAIAKTLIKPGDIIIEINDKKIKGLRDYAQELAKYKPNDKVKITYLSENETKTVEIILQKK